MKNFLIFCLVVISCTTVSEAHYTQQWAVEIEGGPRVADDVARDHGFVNHGLIFSDHYHFSHSGVAKRSLVPNAEKKTRLAVDTRVKSAKQQVAKRRVKRDLKVQDSDPKWQYMWYLNRGGGLDLNVIPAWMEGITGKGAVVTILDDGLEKDHPDLLQNYDPMASYDVNGHDSDPSPRYDMIDSNRHGTRCAGEVAATSNNSICALGVAHGARVGGVRMLDGDVTDAVEARSLSLNPHHVDIYSASWGPDDDGKTVDGPGDLAVRAFVEGVTKGRKGKGSIFVWASGNGGRDHDNCNCDGYTNSIYSLSISSATEHGHVPWYSEACSSTLASTYSSGGIGERQVVTTDLRHSCTSSHTGTSASAPLAAGICALALEANPRLTWRDMQHIVVRTARPHNLMAPDWRTNGVGRNVSHSFGYGLMDAHAMVRLARSWTTVPEQRRCEVTAPNAVRSIPAKSVAVLQLTVKECEGVNVLEHVQAKLTIASQKRGDLNIQLTSPMGTRATLLARRSQDTSRQGFNVWPFMSVHSWGESPFGTWQLEIHNDGSLLGEVKFWQLTVYGTSTPPAYDVQNGNGEPPLSEVFSGDIFHNSIYDSSSNWDSGAENRKDTLEVEETEKSTSGCAKPDGNLCLECLPNHYLYQRICIQKCPEKYFNSILENDSSKVENQTCLPCHYSCKHCIGSLDLNCIECYGDAKIVRTSSTDSYCYPVHILSEVLSEKWYYRMFTMTYVIVILMTISAVICLCIKRRRLMIDDRMSYISVDVEDNLKLSQKPINSTIYTDNE